MAKRTRKAQAGPAGIDHEDQAGPKPPKRARAGGTIAQIQNHQRDIPTVRPTKAQKAAQAQADPWRRSDDGRFGEGNRGGPGGPREGAGRKSRLSRQYHDQRVERLLRTAWKFLRDSLRPDEVLDLETFDARWKVARYVIDRAHGRPRQTMEVQADGFEQLSAGTADRLVSSFLAARGEAMAEKYPPAQQEIPAEDPGEGRHEVQPKRLEVPGL